MGNEDGESNANKGISRNFNAKWNLIYNSLIPKTYVFKLIKEKEPKAIVPEQITSTQVLLCSKNNERCCRGL